MNTNKCQYCSRHIDTYEIVHNDCTCDKCNYEYNERLKTLNASDGVLERYEFKFIKAIRTVFGG